MQRNIQTAEKGANTQQNGSTTEPKNDKMDIDNSKKIDDADSKL